MIYIVTYDLLKPGQDYSGLIKAISQYHHVHPLESVWFIKSMDTSEKISEDLLKWIDTNDRIFIGEIRNNYSGWMTQYVWDFLQSS